MSSSPETSTPRPSWLLIGATAALVLFVLVTPFSAFIGGEELLRWWLVTDTALTVLIGLKQLVRPTIGCLQVFVPLFATTWVVASFIADRDLVGPWHLVVHVLGLVALVVGSRRHRARRTGEVADQQS